MKKITTIIGTLILANAMVAQQVNHEIKPQCSQEAVKHYTPSEFNQLKNSKAYGDVIWEETFGGSAIPAGWVTVDNNSQGNVWLWTNNPNPGLSGQYSASTSPFISTTATNGYMTLPGDHYNTPTPPTFVNMNAYLLSSPINCDTASSVMLKFEQVFRFCCGGLQTLQVSVSTDNVNWTDFEVTKGVETNSTSENPDIVTINITPIAAFQSTVYLKFYMANVSHYYWAIDDVALVVAPANDIRIAKTYVSGIAQNAGNYEYTGFYSSIPLNQVTPISINADIYNFGNATQHDVIFNASIINSLGTEVYNQEDGINYILPDSTEFIEIATPFIGYEADTFEINFGSYQLETDEVPDNNSYESIRFNINNDKVYARDYQLDSRIGVASFNGGLPGDFLGINYYINAIDTVASISVFIDVDTDAGTVLLANLYRLDGTSQTWVIASDEYEIQTTDLGQWVTIPFISMIPGDNVLEEHTTYIAGVECYYMTGESLYLGADSNGPHLFHLASVLRLGASWYYIGNLLPLIRLNLSGANVLPFITSTPTNEVEFTDPYSYNVTTLDPQGLPVTLSATCSSTDINMVATDNGDGTMSISTPIISTTSFGNNGFQVSITVDNGIASNFQTFWVDVANVVSVEKPMIERFTIYPNPVKESLQCTHVANAKIQIFSIAGKLIYQDVSANANSTIDVSSFSEGTYFIKVINDKKALVQKFIIVK